MALCKQLGTMFGKRKRKNAVGDELVSSSSACVTATTIPSEEHGASKQQQEEASVDHNIKEIPNICRDSSFASTSATTISSCDTSCSEFGDEDETENNYHLGSKPSALNKNEKDTPASPFLMIGSDVMVSVITFLEPREILNLLTMPLCKEWRVSYTADQDLWRTACSTEPFSADLRGNSIPIEASSSSCKADDEEGEYSAMCSLDDFKHAFERKNGFVGEYRLIYTSFIRCMNYLDRIQNNSGLDDSSSSSSGKESNKSDHGNDFPTFGVTKSLKQFLFRSKERSILRSVIGNGTTSDIPSAPIGVSTDGREIQEDPMSKKAIQKENNDKPKYGHSMITSRLWRPTANGIPSHLNLPKSCAIYSVVNWMVAHPNVLGIQIMCIRSLPSLLEDEQQRLIGRRVGLVEVILCAMLRFPDNVELHIEAFHAIVLLARPLGGREGMLFDNSMAETTQNIGLTSHITLSDSVSLTTRCGGNPSLKGKTSNQHATVTTTATCDSSLNNTIEYRKQTGISIMVDSMERFSSSEKIQSMACWSLVNVALVPLQKNMVMNNNGVEAVLNAMEKHSKSFEVQFRALFALINLAVPCRRSDFTHDSSVNAEDAVRVEESVLNRLGARIAKLSISAMKNFFLRESILNRGCLVIHNLSQSSEFMPTLLETPDCYQILDYCFTNHSSDRVLRRSVLSTIQRMQNFLDSHPEHQQRFSISLSNPRNADTFEQVW